MAGAGIGAMVTEGQHAGNGAVNVDIGKELKDTFSRVKNVADAAAVGTLMRSIAGDTQAPTKDEASVANTTISIAKDLTEMQTGKEKSAREDAEYWRQRAEDAEGKAKENRLGERQQNMDAMAAMGSMMQGMSTMVVGLVEKMAAGVQQPKDDLRDSLLGYALQNMMAPREDPDEVAARRLKAMREMAEAMGYRRDTGSGNVTSLEHYRAVKEFELQSRRLELEATQVDRKLAVEESRAKSMTDVLGKVIPAIAGRAAGRTAGSGGNGNGGSAGNTPAPSQPRRTLYQCGGDGGCGTVTGVEDGKASFFCSGCGKNIAVQTGPGAVDNAGGQ